MICPKCSASVPNDAKFCPVCQAMIEANAPDPLVGRVLLNQYVVQKKLGEGGYGAVYEAEQPAFRRKVAVKTLHKHLSTDPKVVQRFRREGMVASQLEHPSAVKMLATGETEDGFLWIAMEFISGETLEDRIQKKGPLTPAELIDIFEPVCAVIEEAHQKGIIHRDLKPDNIMLINQQGKILPKVLDFGIAGIVDNQDSNRPTKTGIVTGTPPYMPPEQWKGLKHTDARSDIYALGIIVYECLSGKLPFEAETIPDWMSAHIFKPPKDFATVMDASKLPKQMVGAVMKALAKEPKDRYQSVREFFRELSASADEIKTTPDTASMGAAQKATLAQASATPMGTSPTLPHTAMQSLAPPVQRPSEIAKHAPLPSVGAPPSKRGYLIGAAAVVGAALALYLLLAKKETSKVAPPVSVVTPGENPSDPANPSGTPPKPSARWQEVETDIAEDLRGVFGSASNNLYVVGTGGLVAHSRDGKSFSVEIIPRLNVCDGGLGSVWVDEEGTPFVTCDSVLLRRGESNWAVFAFAGIRPFVSDVFGASGGVPIAVGSQIIRIQGDAATKSDIPKLRGSFNAIWGSSNNDLYAVGDEGIILRSTNGGASWSELSSGVGATLNDVAGGAGHLFAVGQGGTILHSNNQGKSWTQEQSGVNQNLRSVWVVSKDVYVVGDNGLILHSGDQGKTWERQESNTSSRLYAIWGSPSGVLYAVGDQGTILTLQ